MRSRILCAIAAVLSGAIALPAQAQPTPAARPAAQPQRVELPAGGLTFSFAEIDRNGDSSISVEEWNAFVAALQSRVARTDADARPGGAAAAGGTRAPESRPLTPPPR